MSISDQQTFTRRSTAALALSAWLTLVIPALAGAVCQPGIPPGTLPVSAPGVYGPSPDLWYQAKNWTDTNGNGQFDLKAGNPDAYNLTLAGSNSPIRLADPSVMEIGDWFYVTGTTNTPGRWTGNFEIYRTRDFVNFELHMLAFDQGNPTVPDPGQCLNCTCPRQCVGKNGSGQCMDTCKVGSGYFNRINLNHGKWYVQLWAPQLYIDPTHGGADPMVNLNFTAVENHADAERHSIFHVRLRRSRFLAWHGKNPLTADGPRFADPREGTGFQAWFHYKPNNDASQPSQFDGGFSQGRLIPASGQPQDLMGPGCGQLEQRGYGYSHRCHGSASWMYIDPFVFFDPNLANQDTWKRVMLYNWQDENPGVLQERWGNHVAGAPLQGLNFRFDANGWVIPIAMNRNINNKVNGIDNGALNRFAQTWPGGAVAEGPTAFYHAGSGRYYVLYSRNTWNSPAYQILYRMTQPGQQFRDIQLSWFMDKTVPEHILLRANHFYQAETANFGHPEVFTIRDQFGLERHYLLFHVKLDFEGAPGYTGRRTLFVKELTLESTSTGKLKRLYENHADIDRDIRSFRMPACRQ